MRPEAPNNENDLPAFSPALLQLPYALGSIQRWVLGRMKYQSAGAAAVTTLALVSHIAMKHITVASYDGLGLNEQYLVLAPTGFRQILRKPFEVIRKTNLKSYGHRSGRGFG